MFVSAKLDAVALSACNVGMLQRTSRPVRIVDFKRRYVTCITKIILKRFYYVNSTDRRFIENIDELRY